MTREDQGKINAFSRLHQREKVLQEELQTKQVCYDTRGGRVLQGQSCFCVAVPFCSTCAFVDQDIFSCSSIWPIPTRKASSDNVFLGLTWCLLLQKDKEDLEEVSMELELADEDELVL